MPEKIETENFRATTQSGAGKIRCASQDTSGVSVAREQVDAPTAIRR